MGYDLAEKDLAQIRNVLNYLEHSADFLRAYDSGAIVGVNDWRARIRTVLAMPRLPIQIELQGIDLLGRLDHLEASRYTSNNA
ncbi:hypothetical protein VSR34_17665 [Paraburkholderia sp. JHI2823]|uniref:hypothetical protein n=1 Tax=Paraburkholderia TaxID=1822464 RepID=UPI00041E1D52|nr:hypothetical protein [Paraburkholderia mimosarum]